MNDPVWIIWLAVVLGSFGILEWRGIKRSGERGTLSAQFWRWMFYERDGKRRPRPFVWFTITSFLIWLTVHFATGGAV